MSMRNKGLIPPIVALLLLATASVAPGLSQLDIDDGGLILKDNTLAEVAEWIRLGANYESGYWDGEGIISSQAAADGGGTGVGYMLNNVDGEIIYDEFFGVGGLDGSEILVRYTYWGDCNLDGKVDWFDDFSVFQDGIVGLGSGWLYGDLDYDGDTDWPDDFSMFQDGYSAYLAGGPLAGGPIATLPVSTNLAVPEPVTGALGLGLAALALYIRRRCAVEGRGA
jgi:hypothetical protein